jgi:hypothetical protein
METGGLAPAVWDAIRRITSEHRAPSRRSGQRGRAGLRGKTRCAVRRGSVSVVGVRARSLFLHYRRLVCSDVGHANPVEVLGDDGRLCNRRVVRESRGDPLSQHAWRMPKPDKGIRVRGEGQIGVA